MCCFFPVFYVVWCQFKCVLYEFIDIFIYFLHRVKATEYIFFLVLTKIIFFFFKLIFFYITCFEASYFIENDYFFLFKKLFTVWCVRLFILTMSSLFFSHILFQFWVRVELRFKFLFFFKINTEKTVEQNC